MVVLGGCAEGRLGAFCRVHHEWLSLGLFVSLLEVLFGAFGAIDLHGSWLEASTAILQAEILLRLQEKYVLSVVVGELDEAL